MPEDVRPATAFHTVIIEGRGRMRLTGITDIERFDEETVAVYTSDGELFVSGRGLHIGRIDIEAGELTLEGTIDSLEYTDDRPTAASWLSRFFK